MQSDLIPVTPAPMSLEEARGIVGSLSNPSKMPAYAWGISAKECGTGSRLAKLKGTACSICYARKGRYVMPSVTRAQARRLEGLRHPQWAEAMVVMIGHHTPVAVPYFRWFDSGDLQSYHHLLQIIWIAEQLPEVSFWLPTSERRFLKRLRRENRALPRNLIIRYSSPLINSESDFWSHNSLVVTDNSATCMAKFTGNKCDQCRKCWDRSVKSIRYRKH